jgi:hypothetical protein
MLFYGAFKIIPSLIATLYYIFSTTTSSIILVNALAFSLTPTAFYIVFCIANFIAGCLKLPFWTHPQNLLECLSVCFFPICLSQNFVKFILIQGLWQLTPTNLIFFSYFLNFIKAVNSYEPKFQRIAPSFFNIFFLFINI